MKHKKDFVLQQVAGMYVVAPVGKAAASFKKMITFNETGAFLWEALDEDLSEIELVDRITEEYIVTRETAERDVHTFVTKLITADLIEQ